MPSPSGIETGYAATYHLDAIDPQVALPVDILDSSEMRDIDIRLARTPVFHIRCRFQPSDRRYAGVVQLISEFDPVNAIASVPVQPPDYIFDFGRDPPGSYTAYAASYVGCAAVAAQIVQFSDHDLSNLVLTGGTSEIPCILKLKSGNSDVDLRKTSVVVRPIELRNSPLHFEHWDSLKIGDDLRFRFSFTNELRQVCR